MSQYTRGNESVHRYRLKGLQQDFRDTEFHLFEARDSGLTECAGGEIPKITLGITGLPEVLGRDYGI